MKAELFIIEPGVWKAADREEVSATCEAVQELGLYHLPYNTVTVRLPGNEFLRIKDKGEIKENNPYVYADLTIHEPIPVAGDPNGIDVLMPTLTLVNTLSGFTADMTDRLNITMGGHDEAMMKEIGELGEAGVTLPNGKTLSREQCDMLVVIQEQVRMFLVTLLATRNVRKTTTVNKLAKLGIGKRKYKNRFSHITTISLPRPDSMDDDAEHKPTGQHRAPHLRRGHIRHQHYGPKRSYVKKVWIAPIFVNADPDFVSKREAYNLSGGFK